MGLDSGSKDHPELSRKISVREQMAIKYTGFSPHGCEVQAIQEKKKNGLNRKVFYSSYGRECPCFPIWHLLESSQDSGVFAWPYVVLMESKVVFCRGWELGM